MSALRSVVLVLTVLLAGAAPIGAAPGSDVSFAEERVVEQTGDIASFTLSIPTNSNVTIEITGPRLSQEISVVDGGDGHVALLFNTYNGTWQTRNAEDIATVTSKSSIEWPPNPAEYRVAVAKHDASTTLVLGEPGLRRIGTFVGNGTYQTIDQIEQAKASNELSMASPLTTNATVVVQLDATGLAGAISAADGDDTTARFRSFFAQQTATFEFEQTNPSPERKPKDLRFGPGVHVVAAEDTYYVVVDLSEARFGRDSGENSFDDGDRFVVSVSLAAASPLTDEQRRSVATRVGNARAEIQTPPDKRLHLRAAPKQSIVGTTTIGAGWNVSIVLETRDNPETEANETAIRKRVVTVQKAPEDDELGGKFGASFDLSNVSAGTEVTVDVLREGTSLLQRNVTGVVAARTAAVTAATPRTVTNFTAVRVNVTLGAGGFVVLHRNGPTGPAVGASEYLPPGNHSRLVYVSEPVPTSATIVAVAHRDTNHNHWFDGPKTDPQYDEAVDATTPTPTPTRTPKTTPTPTVTTSKPYRTTTSTGPGFALVTGLLAFVVFVTFTRKR